MRKYALALSAFMLAASQWASAIESPFVGTNVGANDFTGGDFYLYNVSTGKWLQDNDCNPDYWTSHANVGYVGLDFQLIPQAEALTFIINPKFGNNHSLVANGLWMDTTRPTVTWTATPVEAGDAYVYELTGTEDGVLHTLGINANGHISDRATQGTEWQFVSKEERLNYLISQASTENPVNLTWLVPGATFSNTADERISAWQKSRNNNFAIGGNGSPKDVVAFIRQNFVFEAWALGDFTIEQTVADMPDGKYRVSAQGFYSPVDGAKIVANGTTLYQQYLAGEVPNYATLFANDQETPIPSIFDDAQDSKITNMFGLSIGDGKYIPQHIWHFSNAVAHGYYNVAQPINVTISDGNLHIGAKVQGAPGGAWFSIDQFKVEYLGPDSNVGVEETIATPERVADGKIYNLMGVEVKDMSQPGLYIVNGKKILK